MCSEGQKIYPTRFRLVCLYWTEHNIDKSLYTSTSCHSESTGALTAPLNLGLVARKPVFWVSENARLKRVSSATETS